MQPLESAKPSYNFLTNKSKNGNHEHHTWRESRANKPKNEYSSLKKTMKPGDSGQVDTYIKARIKHHLEYAAYKFNINKSKVNTDENIDSLVKNLRTRFLDKNNHNKWLEWSESVFKQIESGALELMASVRYWQNEMTSDGKRCTVTSIKLSGSDLHGKGLGAAFVEFDKAVGAGNVFKDKNHVKVVLKPEDRSIEKSLLGNQDKSLANKMNRLAGLKSNRLRTIEMETHDEYGSIIEFIEGTQAQNLSTNTNAYKRGMSESIVFSFLTGLTDLHRENVIWGGRQGRNPYLIDADNALNFNAMSNPSAQNGYAFYNKAETDTEIDNIRNNPDQVRSLIFKKIKKNPVKFFNSLKKSFTNKKGRIVPRVTNYWGEILNLYPYSLDEEKTQSIKTAAKNLKNNFLLSPGLVGECGTSSQGEMYNETEEAKQLKIDFDRGQIPFYSYDYNTGYVYHNGQVIWHGRSIDDAIADLRTKLGL